MEWLTQVTTLCAGERGGRYREVEPSRSNPLGNDLPSAAQLSTHQHQQRGGGEEGGALSKLANNQFLVQLCTRGGKSRTQFDIEEWKVCAALLLIVLILYNITITDALLPKESPRQIKMAQSVGRSKYQLAPSFIIWRYT